jgi:hypothetical protein
MPTSSPLQSAGTAAEVFERRRVLIVADLSERGTLLQLFGDASLDRWQPILATAVEEARLVLEQESCDVMVLDESFSRLDERYELSGLARAVRVPIILLAGTDRQRRDDAFAAGLGQKLHRDLVLGQVEVLAASLDQAVRQVSPDRPAPGKGRQASSKLPGPHRLAQRGAATDCR